MLGDGETTTDPQVFGLGVECAKRMDSIGLAGEATFKESYEGGKGWGEEHSRQRGLKKCLGVT